jgi:hypothetical protein
MRLSAFLLLCRNVSDQLGKKKCVSCAVVGLTRLAWHVELHDLLALRRLCLMGLAV